MNIQTSKGAINMETGRDYLIQQLETCRTFSENIEGIIEHECSLHHSEEKIEDKLTDLKESKLLARIQKIRVELSV